MNDDTHMLYEGLANDEMLYNECEGAARYAGMVSDSEEEFRERLADEIRQVAEANEDIIPGFSNSEEIDYGLVDYDEIANVYKYDDYK